MDKTPKAYIYRLFRWIHTTRSIHPARKAAGKTEKNEPGSNGTNLSSVTANFLPFKGKGRNFPRFSEVVERVLIRAASGVLALLDSIRAVCVIPTFVSICNMPGLPCTAAVMLWRLRKRDAL